MHVDERHILERNNATWPINAFQKAAGQAIRAAGLTGIVWHGLRGTAASWGSEGGATDQQLAALLGHRSVQTTRHYSRGAQQKRLAQAAVDAIELPIANASKTPSGKHKGARVTNTRPPGS